MSSICLKTQNSELPWVTAFDLLPVFIPFNFSVGTVHCALHLHLPLCLPLLLQIQLLLKSVLWVCRCNTEVSKVRQRRRGTERLLTFNLEVSLGGEIVALSNRASVATRVSGLGLLDDQTEGVLVSLKPELGTFVAFLGEGEQFY